MIRFNRMSRCPRYEGDVTWLEMLAWIWPLHQSALHFSRSFARGPQGYDRSSTWGTSPTWSWTWMFWVAPWRVGDGWHGGGEWRGDWWPRSPVAKAGWETKCPISEGSWYKPRRLHWQELGVWWGGEATCFPPAQLRAWISFALKLTSPHLNPFLPRKMEKEAKCDHSDHFYKSCNSLL